MAVVDKVVNKKPDDTRQGLDIIIRTFFSVGWGETRGRGDGMGLAVNLYWRQPCDWQLDCMWCERKKAEKCIRPGSGRMQLSVTKVRRLWTTGLNEDLNAKEAKEVVHGLREQGSVPSTHIGMARNYLLLKFQRIQQLCGYLNPHGAHRDKQAHIYTYTEDF